MSGDLPFPKRVPEFSRAVDDSEDSDWEEAAASVPAAAPGDPGTVPCCLRLRPEVRRELLNSGGRFESATLVVSVGPEASAFATAWLLAEEAEGVQSIVGLVTCGFPERCLGNSLGQIAPGDFNCFLYRLRCNPQVLLCRCQAPIPEPDCYAFAESILSLFDADSLELAVLGSEPLAAYQSDLPASSLPVTLLRCLRTSVARETKQQQRPLETLEPPNLLTGLPAQLLTACQIRRISCVAFIVYATPVGGDHGAAAAAAFRPALDCVPLRGCRLAWPRDAPGALHRLCAPDGAANADTARSGCESVYI